MASSLKASTPTKRDLESGAAGLVDRLLRSTLGPALLGSLLLWASLPPLGWWPLAWIAPVPWLLLVRRPTLVGRRPYLSLWLAGCAFWLPMLYWLCLPHPATSIGWLALSLYLGCYLPLFVGLTRVAVYRLKISSIVAAPIVWVGFEKAEAHLFTGFGMASLGQTQFRWLEMIQIADLAGGYTVTFLVMGVAACLARALPLARESRRIWPLLLGVGLMAASLGYGYWRIAGEHTRPGPAITLIQGSVDTEIKFDPNEAMNVFMQYLDLSRKAVHERPDTQLVVWPETMYRRPLVSFSPDAHPGEEDEWTMEQVEARAAEARLDLAGLAADLKAPLLMGLDARDVGPGFVKIYNSAQFVGSDGQLGPRYDKVHPVIFGEYVPLADRWPWLYRFTPLGGGIDAGTKTPAMTVPTRQRDGNTARIAPNICYESVLGHVINRQVSAMRERGEEPDLLVNLTNDGWFYGSTELDLHLMCGVFRAVEQRKPFLSAANTGFSAWIDADGRIRWQGPRRATAWYTADVDLDSRSSLYSRIGDWPAGLCLVGCLVLAGVGWRRRQ